MSLQSASTQARFGLLSLEILLPPAPMGRVEYVWKWSARASILQASLMTTTRTTTRKNGPFEGGDVHVVDPDNFLMTRYSWRCRIFPGRSCSLCCCLRSLSCCMSGVGKIACSLKVPLAGSIYLLILLREGRFQKRKSYIRYRSILAQAMPRRSKLPRCSDSAPTSHRDDRVQGVRIPGNDDASSFWK